MLPPLVRAEHALRDGEVGHRAPADLRHPRADALGQFEVRRVADLDDAGVEVAQRAGDGVQLIDGGDVRREELAVHAGVAGVAVERYAERSGLDAVAHCGLYRLDLVAGGLALLGVGAHHPAADRGVADHHAVVDAEVVVERAEVVAERAPAPRHAVHQHVVGDGLDLREHPGERGLVALAHGRERQRAVAAHHGRDAVVAGEGAERVERHLPVVVGVVVDEAGGDDAAARVDLARRRAVQPSDGGDAPVHDADVGNLRGIARPVHHEAALDEQIERHRTPPPERWAYVTP